MCWVCSPQELKCLCRAKDPFFSYLFVFPPERGTQSFFFVFPFFSLLREVSVSEFPPFFLSVDFDLLAKESAVRQRHHDALNGVPKCNPDAEGNRHN